ncbi:M20 family metallopeptidase [Halovivax sp.]|uniref:M20 family metallopeptidase n=1 Tax=Halovivax sp. TaxID=1935978 RepID=UPI0025C06314|nr:M20/M25/M40 family metallo-hydrolase [Halovivax sp.]
MTLPALTRELVATPSHDDETAVGDRIESWLRAETDATVRRDDVGNVFARRGASSGPQLALVGHHDVVPPDPSQVDGDAYAVEERDGRLYGRGTADMKGAVAAMMLAFRDAEPARAGANDPGGLVFASFVGEEIGGVGARHAIDEGFAPDYAVVGEGSTNYSRPDVTDVVVAHKGRRGSTIAARGAAAHASEPEAGENAIYLAADVVADVRDLAFPSVEIGAAGETLAGSIAVTEIDGGAGMNVIPERCDLTIDERTVPGERAPLDRVADRDGVEWTVDQDLPPMRCGDAEFAETVREAADDVQEGTPTLTIKPHATDAGWLADRAGTDCVVVGPSEPGEAHTADESVSLEVLDRCRAIYRELAERWPA